MLVPCQKVHNAPYFILGTARKLLVAAGILEVDFEDAPTAGWANDEVMRANTFLLYDAARQARRYVVVFDSQTIEKLHSDGSSYLNKAFRGKKLPALYGLPPGRPCDWPEWLMPIHCGDHWYLLHVEVNGRRMTVYDSMGHDSKNEMGKHHLRTVFLVKSYFAAVPLAARIGVFDWALSFSTANPRQRDAWSCGYHVCEVARRICTMEPIDTPVCVEDVARRVLANMLSYNSVPFAGAWVPAEP